MSSVEGRRPHLQTQEEREEERAEWQRAQVRQRANDREAVMRGLVNHFDKMVAASMNNRHHSEKMTLMSDFLVGLREAKRLGVL